MLVFESRGPNAVFLGWKIHNGQYWARAYYVALLDDFRYLKLGGKVWVHTTPKVIYDAKNIKLPLKEAFDKSRESLTPVLPTDFTIDEVIDGDDNPFWVGLFRVSPFGDPGRQRWSGPFGVGPCGARRARCRAGACP